MSMSCVLTVDIKGSKKMKAHQRGEVQKRLLDLIDHIEAKFAEKLMAIGMTGGDEFQIVLKSPEETISVFKFLKTRLPVKFYFGVGVGEVEGVEGEPLPSEMYGSAFYSSRGALEKAKEETVQMVFRTGDEKLDFQLNTIIRLILFIRDNWTERQRQILTFMERHEGMMQKEVAEHFHISEQAISKTVIQSGFRLVRQAELLMEKLLTQKDLKTVNL